MGGNKKDCHVKKCKRNCVEFNYIYDQATLVVYDPIVNTRTPLIVGAPVSFSQFGFCPVKNIDSGQEVALFEFNNSCLIRLVSPNQTTLVQSTITALFPDGVSSMCFTITYASTDGSKVPSAQYKATAYSSNGVYLDKNCYITVTYPPTGTNVFVNLKVCDKKTCANK